MAMELVTRELVIKVPVGETRESITTEEDLLLPDMKPNIGRIISVNAKADRPEFEFKNGKAELKGEVQSTVIYVADEGEIRSIKQTFPYQMSINMTGIEPETKGKVMVSMGSVTAKPINERKMQLRMDIVGEVEAWLENTIAVIEDITEPMDAQMLKETNEIEVYCGRAREVIAISDEITIPNRIWEVLESNAYINDYQFLDKGGYGEVKGNAKIHALYTTDEGMKDMQVFETLVPFESMISLEGIGEANRFEMDLKIRASEVYAQEDDLGELTKFKVDMEAESDLQGYSDEVMDTLIDAFAPNMPIEIEKTQIIEKEESQIAEGSFSTMVRVEVEEPYPAVESVATVKHKIRESAVRVDNNKAFVNGMLDLRIIYNGTDDTGLRAVSYELPFERDIDVADVPSNALVNAKLDIENIVCSVVSPSLLEPRIDMRFVLSKVTEEAQELSIGAKMASEAPKEPAGDIIICTAKMGDKVWDIAKKHLVKLDDITDLEGNNLDDEIECGQRIMIQTC